MLFISHCHLNHVLLCSCLLLLSACSGDQVVIHTQTQYLLPPKALIPECHEPTFIGSTYGDVVEHAVQLQGAFDECHVEIDVLNQWVKQHQTDSDSQQQLETQGTPKG